MATTIVPDPRPLLKNIDLQKLLEIVHEDLVFVTRDLDKAGDMDSASYYEGIVEAYTFIEKLLTDPDSDVFIPTSFKKISNLQRLFSYLFSHPRVVVRLLSFL